MRSTLIAAVLVAFVAALLSPLSVTADGSIQPFRDSNCLNPIGNVTYLSIATSSQCQWITVDGQRVSFSYQCQSGTYSNFSLVVWANTSGAVNPCEGQPIWSVQFVDMPVSGCPEAIYSDQHTKVAFNAHLYCEASAPSKSHSAGLEGLAPTLQANVVALQAIPQEIKRAVASNLGQLPEPTSNVNSKTSHRLTRNIKQKQ